MCDIHGKKLDYYCLHHDEYCCRKCKLGLHDVHPCECLHVRDVYDRLQLEMEEHIQDVVSLRDRGKRILDGSYQRNLLYRVNDEEQHLDRFYKEMKKKFKETKLKIQAFTADELSEFSRGQLHTFISRQIPGKFSKSDKPRDMYRQLKNVKRAIHNANQLMYSLPNYIETNVDPKFMNLMTYNGDPIVIRGRPKYMTQVSSDEEFDGTDEFDEMFDNGKLSEDDFEINAKKRVNFDRGITYKQSKVKEVTNKSAPARDIFIDDDDESEPHTGVLRWSNNAPTFSVSASGAKPVVNGSKSQLPNKYEKEIAAAKERLKLPPVSRTPDAVRRIKDRIDKKNTARSMPDDILTDRPAKKLFLKHTKSTKFKVRERFQLDGCEDAIVLKDSIILSLGDKVQKRDRKTLKLGVEMKLTNCSTMCAIHGSSTHIAVIQLRKCISVLDTQFGVSVVYKIKIQQDYIDLCHIGTTDAGPHHPSYIFACIYKGYPNKPVNCVDLIQARETRRPGRPPMFEPRSKEINIPADGYKPKAIFGIGGFSDGHIVLGTEDAVLCINDSGKVVWKTKVPREVSGILCTKSLIYVCVQDQKRIAVFNKSGFLTDENIIPDLDIIPCKVSANWDIMLVKDFKTKAWISIVFKHGLFIV